MSYRVSPVVFLLAMVTRGGGGGRGDQLTTTTTGYQDLYHERYDLLTVKPEHPHARLTTPELVKIRGYPAEIHEVITDDGYIIEIHRIPYGRYSPYALRQPVQQQSPNPFYRNYVQPTNYVGVLHQKPSTPSFGSQYDSRFKFNHISNHFNDGRLWRKDVRNETYGGSRSKDLKVVLIFPGILSSSADFVMNDPDQALGFILADAGYDVWLANYRGNFYARKHKYLTPSDPAFWDHTWNEIARYDVPALLRYVREVSGSSRVSYIGFSMGTSVFFASFSYHPELTSWVRSMVALAPVGYIYHRPLPLGLLSPFTFLIERVLQRAGMYEVFPLEPERQAPTKAAFCSPDSITRAICDFYLQFQSGFNQGYVDQKYLPVILAHYTAGAGYRVFLHLLQLHASRKFQAYDYGAKRNQRVYGQVTPPGFDLSKVKVPVALFWSDNDFLASTLDVAQTASELPNVALNHRIKLDLNHLDFLWAENANVQVYRPVLAYLDAFY